MGKKEKSHFLSISWVPQWATLVHVIVGSWGISCGRDHLIDLMDTRLPGYVPLVLSSLCPVPEHDCWVTSLQAPGFLLDKPHFHPVVEMGSQMYVGRQNITF